MFVSAEGIVLRIHPWSNSSHFVTWLTPGRGRVTTRIKGACRPKSPFLGQYDLCYTCDVVYYARETGGVHAAREVTPLDVREALRGDWRAFATAGYFTELARHVSVPMQEAHAHYALLRDDLDGLCRAPPSEAGILLHELRLLQLLGVMPRLAVCDDCRPAPGQAVRYSISAGRCLCRHTPPAAATDVVLAVPPGVLHGLRGLAATPPGAPPRMPQEAGENSANDFSLGIRRFLGIFMRHHLELSLGPRRTLFDLLGSLPRPVGNAPRPQS